MTRFTRALVALLVAASFGVLSIGVADAQEMEHGRTIRTCRYC